MEYRYRFFDSTRDISEGEYPEARRFLKRKVKKLRRHMGNRELQSELYEWSTDPKCCYIDLCAEINEEEFYERYDNYYDPDEQDRKSIEEAKKFLDEENYYLMRDYYYLMRELLSNNLYRTLH